MFPANLVEATFKQVSGYNPFTTDEKGELVSHKAGDLHKPESRHTHCIVLEILLVPSALSNQ